jgi:subtilisin family serine protease
MGKRAILILLASLVMLLPSWGAELGSATETHAWGRPSYAPGELLVKYKSAVGTAAADYFRQHWGVWTLHTFRDIGVHHVKLPADMTVEEALDLYRNNPDVEYAEPNYYRHISVIPNDTAYGLLWGMSQISAPAAWDVRTDCTAVTVATIDTGVDYNHPDLSSNIWSNAGEVADGTDDDGNGYIDDVRGWDFVDNDNAPMDAHGHGTHVAGTIGAVGNNSLGVTGVCWTAKVMPLRAFDASGSATTATIIDAMEYARTQGAKIINASYGDSSFSQTEYDEISSLNTAGVLLVAAAGNSGTDNDKTRFYPASYNLPNIIAVAATDQNDNLASFSNYGKTSVDVAAPGVNIDSTKPGRHTVFSDNFDNSGIAWTLESPWAVTTARASSGAYSLEDSPGGNYGNGINVSARPTNAIDLSGSTGTVLDFKLNGVVLAGDVLYIETSPDASTWTTRLGLYGDSGGQWVDLVADLGNLDGTPQAHFRFRLQTNSSGRADGVYIDDVQVTSSASQDTYQFLSGTSMATPHVTGLAALVWSNTPTLTHLQVKARILNCVDRLASLSKKVVTWGRINAANSLNNVPAPPVGLSARAVSNSQINLTWANTYLDPIGFKIERKEGAAGTFAQIVDLPSNTASFSDTGLIKGTTYTYHVRAYTSGNESEWSAEVTTSASKPSSSAGGGGGGGGCFIDTALVK